MNLNSRAPDSRDGGINADIAGPQTTLKTGPIHQNPVDAEKRQAAPKNL